MKSNLSLLSPRFRGAKRFSLYALLIILLLLNTGCFAQSPSPNRASRLPDTEATDAVSEDASDGEESDTTDEATPPKKETVEEALQRVLRVPEKKDIAGKWDVFLGHREANSEIIDLEDADTDFIFNFYLDGDQLMVSAFGVNAPVEYSTYEDIPHAKISFTIVVPVEEMPGVDAPPTASYWFETTLAWKRAHYDVISENEESRSIVLGSDRFTLHMGYDAVAIEAPFKWQWGELESTGVWFGSQIE